MMSELGLSGMTPKKQLKITNEIVKISTPKMILHIAWSLTPALVRMIPSPKANTTPNMANSWVYTPKILTISFGDNSFMYTGTKAMKFPTKNPWKARQI